MTLDRATAWNENSESSSLAGFHNETQTDSPTVKSPTEAPFAAVRITVGGRDVLSCGRLW